jgi:hypothetical protein
LPSRTRRRTGKGAFGNRTGHRDGTRRICTCLTGNFRSSSSESADWWKYNHRRLPRKSTKLYTEYIPPIIIPCSHMHAPCSIRLDHIFIVKANIRLIVYLVDVHMRVCIL